MSMRAMLNRLAVRPASMVTTAGVAVSCAILLFFLVDLYNRHRTEIAAAERTVRNHAQVLAAHTARTFEALDRALREAEHIRQKYIPGRTALAARDAMRHLKQSSPVIKAIGWARVDGQMQIHTLAPDSPQFNIAAQPYFAAHRDGVDDLIITPPSRAADGNWTTTVSRRISAPDGSFAGVTVASIDPDYFLTTYRSVDLGRDGVVALLHRNGYVVAREPYLAGALDKSFANGWLFTQELPHSDSGSYQAPSTADGSARVAGYRAVPGLPLVVMTSYSRADALAAWYRHVYKTGPLIGCVILVILVGTALLQRQTRSLAQKTSVLELTLENMAHGLCMFDKEQRLITCNARYAQIYGLTPDQTRPGTRLRSILEARVTAGHSPEAAEEYIATRLREVESNEASYVVNQLRDGRVVAISHQPTIDGGWVSIHQDVTAQKRIEASLEEANMRFNAALNNMSHGLCMFDGDKRLVVCNDIYAKMYELPPELLKVGTSHHEIITHRVTTGRLKGDRTAEAAQQKLALLGALPTDTGSSRIDELWDGRLISITRATMPDGGWVGTHEDVTERQRSEARIIFMAQHDALTGLPNRVLLRSRLEQQLANVRRGETLAVLYLDLDHFKRVNDTLGHALGDALLCGVAERLKRCVRDCDLVVRLGGDEFAVVQGVAEQPRGASVLAQRIIDSLKEPFDIDSHQIVVGTSVGISVAPTDGVEVDDLLKNADMALYRAKADGRNAFCFFEASMDLRMQERRILEVDLRKAIDRQEFELYYQPILNVASKQITGFEALLRWKHPTRGMVPPDQFIPLAEEVGLIMPIGEWVLRQACAEAAHWPDHIMVAVNLSPVQFHSKDLTATVMSAVTSAGLSPKRLELEITEAVLLHDTEIVTRTLHELRTLGVRIVLDDFGTGYSSLSYLQRFPFDKIKIDKNFIQQTSSEKNYFAIVQAVISLGRQLGMTTTAEGVETKEQLERLEREGCVEVQGYYFSRPQPASETQRLLTTFGPASRKAVAKRAVA
ncbi:MAG: diguanylate cyclase [Xanthobacteraceae bacterium]|nr:diguanylate cyclase [Xanthobacteraceae bacterium]